MPKTPNPFVEHYKKEITILDKTAKMDKELAKFGRPCDFGGTYWTKGDLLRFFEAQKKKRKRRK